MKTPIESLTATPHNLIALAQRCETAARVRVPSRDAELLEDAAYMLSRAAEVIEEKKDG